MGVVRADDALVVRARRMNGSEVIVWINKIAGVAGLAIACAHAALDDVAAANQQAATFLRRIPSRVRQNVVDDLSGNLHATTLHPALTQRRRGAEFLSWKRILRVSRVSASRY